MDFFGKNVRWLNNKFSNIDMILFERILEWNRVCIYWGMFVKNEWLMCGVIFVVIEVVIIIRFFCLF